MSSPTVAGRPSRISRTILSATLATALCSCMHAGGADRAGLRVRAEPDVKVAYEAREADFVDDTVTLFRRANAALSSSLGLPPVDGVCLWIAPDRAAFDDHVRSELGYAYHKSPSRRSLVAVSGRVGTVLLSPAAYAADSSYTFDRDKYALLVAHEVVHLYHFRADPAYLDAPPFVVEGLAVFLSGQYRTLSEFRSPVADALREDRVPAPEDVVANPKLAYAWGWTLIGALDAELGREATRRLMEAREPGAEVARLVAAPTFAASWRRWIAGVVAR